MESFGSILKQARTKKQLTLREAAAGLKMDQAILSKIERGQRKATRDQVVRLAAYYELNENDLLVAWLSDKLVYEVADEEMGLKALQTAEEKVAYIAFKKTDKKDLLKKIKTGLKNFSSIQKAWIYGSFSRGDDGPKSDIDIAIETDEKFSYFDLAEVQFQLEKAINRKVDVGFMDTFKPYIFEHVKPDLKLVYER